MVAKAAPAFAGTTQFLQFTGQACKWPGNSYKGHSKAYVFGIKSTNVNQYTCLVVITAIEVVGLTPSPDQWAIDRQQDNTCIPQGTDVGDFSQEGFGNTASTGGSSLCTGMSSPVVQSDDNKYATFAIAPGNTVFWTASRGEFGNSQIAQMSITYEVWRNGTAGNDPFTCTGAVKLQSLTTTLSGYHSTPPCAVSGNYYPSYSLC
jgi:hypothetical protein